MNRRIILGMAALLILGAACQSKQKTVNTNRGLTIRQGTPAAFGSLAGITSSAERAADQAVTGSTVPANDLVLRPNFSGITYRYAGAFVDISQPTVDVLERTLGTGLLLPTELQATAGLGRLNFSGLDNPRLENLTVRNGDELWSINPIDGTISMYRSSEAIAVMQTEPSPSINGVVTNANPTPPPIDISAAIATSDAYLRQVGISTAPYSQPLVTSATGYGGSVKALDATLGLGWVL